MDQAIRHEPAQRRFTLETEGALAWLTYRELDAHTMDFDHTYVPPALRGGGIASRLTSHALEHARAHGWRVVPSCPFVATFIDRHPQYADLRAPQRGPDTP